MMVRGCGKFESGTVLTKRTLGSLEGLLVM